MNCRQQIAYVLTAAVLMIRSGDEPAQAAPLPASPRSAQEVRQTVRDVLADPEFRHLRENDSPDESDWLNSDNLPQWLRDFLEWLMKDDSRDSPDFAGVDLAGIVYYAALTALAVALAVLIVAIVRSTHSSRASAPEDVSADEEALIPTQPPGDLPANEYEQRALAAAREGDFRRALRELVLGSMSWTERAGLIRYRRGLTNRDYIRAVWRMIDRRESLLQIVAAFERVFYGRRTADGETFERCLGAFQRSFRTEADDAQPSH